MSNVSNLYGMIHSDVIIQYIQLSLLRQLKQVLVIPDFHTGQVTANLVITLAAMNKIRK